MFLWRYIVIEHDPGLWKSHICRVSCRNKIKSNRSGTPTTGAASSGKNSFTHVCGCINGCWAWMKNGKCFLLTPMNCTRCPLLNTDFLSKLSISTIQNIAFFSSQKKEISALLNHFKKEKHLFDYIHPPCHGFIL